MKARLYLNEFRVPIHLRDYFEPKTRVRYFIELSGEYVTMENYETVRKRDNQNIFTISRNLNEYNRRVLNLGLGVKYLFYRTIILQASAGVNKYFPKEEGLNTGGYFNASIGFLF